MTPRRTIALAVLAATLAGCGGGDEAELRAWMDDTRKTMRPTTQPVPEPKQFSPYVYEGKALIDPFDAQKMVLAVARQAHLDLVLTILRERVVDQHPAPGSQREPLDVLLLGVVAGGSKSVTTDAV